MELKACEPSAEEAPPSPPLQGCPLAEEGSSLTGSEGEGGEAEDTKPKAVKTVDARVSALKALQGIGSVVSKSRKVDAEALQQIKQQRARAKSEHSSASGGGGAGANGTAAQCEPQLMQLGQCSAQLEELTSSGMLLRHLSMPSSASCSPADSGPADAAAVLGAATSRLVLHPNPFIAPPSPFPALSTDPLHYAPHNPFVSSLSALPPPSPLSPAAAGGSAQLMPLLRPECSLPPSFSPGDAFQGHHSVGPLGQQQAPQVPADNGGVGGLPAALAEVLPSLSVQELLSLKSAVEGLLLQHAAASMSGSMSLSQAGGAFMDSQQAQHVAQQQAHQALQQAQRAEQALQQLQQAQRAQQASAILQSLSAASVGGPFSTDAPVLPHPHMLMQQRPTPFQSIREEGLQQCTSAGGSLSPITSLDAPGRGSGQTLSPASSGGLGIGGGTTAEQHLLGESLSTFLDGGVYGSSQPRQQHDLSWPSLDAHQSLPRSISMPAAPPICTARSASLSAYLGNSTSEQGGIDAAAFLFSSLQMEGSAPPQSPSLSTLSRSPPTPGMCTHSTPVMPAQPGAMGLSPQQQTRVGAYRSVRFHDMSRTALHAHVIPPKH